VDAQPAVARGLLFLSISKTLLIAFLYDYDVDFFSVEFLKLLLVFFRWVYEVFSSCSNNLGFEYVYRYHQLHLYAIRVVRLISLYSDNVFRLIPMKAYIRRSVRWMPEGVYRRALKAEAEVTEGDIGDLLWDLAVYRHALQRVVDALWDLDTSPKKSQAHQMFYGMLREYGFRAHVARNIYSIAIALVESAKANGGSKPVVKKHTARLD